MKTTLMAVVAVLFLSIAPLWAGGKSENKTTQPAASQPSAASQQQTPASQLFTGDGGKGRSIAIVAPRSTGLAANQNYLPVLVQGEFVSNFANYSAISVMDRIRLDEQYAELLSGYYDENAREGMDLGHLPPTDYMMGGSITRTNTGYALQMNITRNTDKMTVYSYSSTFTFAELDNLSGIRRASLDLLEKMGIQLTAQAKTELAGAAATNHINAQTALSHGIVAQRTGNTIETMARFYEAAAADPALAEAATRANTMSSSIRTGSIGDNIRNDIAWRDEWIKILDDATKFLQANPPVAARVIYDTELTQGNIDYNRRTAEFSFTAQVIDPPEFSTAHLRMMADLNEGLAATGRNNLWNLSPLTPGNVWRTNFAINVNGELLNNTGKVIGQTSNRSHGRSVRSSDSGMTTTWDNSIQRNNSDAPFTLSFNVAADDITDLMTIRLTATASNEGIVWDGVGEHSSRRLINYPVQVMTRAEYQNLLASTGGLKMKLSRQIVIEPILQISERDLKRAENNVKLAERLMAASEEYTRKNTKMLTVEVARSNNEQNVNLSYRPNLADGSGLFLPLENGVIDTNNYQFPISVALLYNYGGTIEQIIDIEPGNRVQIEPGTRKQLTLTGYVSVENVYNAALIVPKGWFNRNNIRVGDEIRNERN